MALYWINGFWDKTKYAANKSSLAPSSTRAELPQSATTTTANSANSSTIPSKSDENQSWEEAVGRLLRLSSPEQRENVLRVPSSCSFLGGWDENNNNRIRHVQQLENWDCGIACLQMVMRWLRENDDKDDDQKHKIQRSNTGTLSPAEIDERNWLIQKIGTQSIWTADLFLLLDELIQNNNNNNINNSDTTVTLKHRHQHDCSYLFCSKNMGVDASLSQMSYYQRQFHGDQKRVQKIFQKIQEKKLAIMEVNQQLSLDRLICVLKLNTVIAIALVDNSILLQKNGSAPESSSPSCCYNKSNAHNYAGHYIILWGISQKPNHVQQAFWDDSSGTASRARVRESVSYCFTVSNPGTNKETTFLTPDRFERAWRSKGTDEDIIFLAKHTVTNTCHHDDSSR